MRSARACPGGRLQVRILCPASIYVFSHDVPESNDAVGGSWERMIVDDPRRTKGPRLFLDVFRHAKWPHHARVGSNYLTKISKMAWVIVGCGSEVGMLKPASPA